MSSRPRALLIAPTVPARTGNGLAMRIGMFLEALAGIADVDVLVLSPAGGQRTPPKLLEELGARLVTVPSSDHLDTQFALVDRLKDRQRRLAAFQAFGRPSLAARITAPLCRDVEELATARGYAIVHVSRSYMIEAGIAAAKIGGRLSIDLDEDDLRSFESQADDAREQASRRESSEPDWLRAEGVACDRLVARHRRQFDRAWAASAYEVASLAARHQRLALRLAPNAIELPPRRSHAPCEPTALLVGSMGYQPNRRGAEWLVGDVWPRVRARSPDARLMIAGAPAPDHLASPQHNVFVLGHMGDLATLYAQASLCVAPLFCGGGTRIKLLEAAAYEVPIVATAIANRGLPFSQPESAWIADSPQDFAEACAEALSSRGEAARRATAARKLVAQFHDRGKIVSQLAGEFSELLSGGAKDGRSDGRRERHLHSHRGP